MSDLKRYAQLAFDRCQRLAAFSQQDDCLDRRYLTTEHQAANNQVAEWMQLAGMKTWQDEAGNQWGSYQTRDANAPTLVMGSHIDTVPNGGKYDGILGVLAPISLLQYFYDHQISLPFHLDIVAFGDEEGTRFGTTLLGSCAIAGTWKTKWAGLTDQNGVDLTQAMREFSLNINNVHSASRQEDKISAFVELHIEQGPVLEAKDLPVGIVTGIAGAKRFTFDISGQAGHAGTVPMHMRQDALVAASEMVLNINSLAKEFAVTATTGHMHVSPGAVNVIPGKVTFSLDVRSELDHNRDKCLKVMLETLRQIAEKHSVNLSYQQTHAADAVACCERLQQQLNKACRRADIQPFSLSSGAGHDAMAMADLCPVGMLFMRCKAGISHHPDESVQVWDIQSALEVLKHFTLAFSE